MTDAEALNRADYIVALDLPKPLLAKEMAREFQRVADECGWQKQAALALQNEITKLQMIIEDQKKIIAGER